MRGEHTHGLLRRETETPIDTVTPALPANSIRMYLPGLTEAAPHLDRLPALARLVTLVLVHHCRDAALDGAVQHGADLDRGPGPDHPLTKPQRREETQPISR